MARHRWSLLCHEAREGQGNNLDLTGVVDELHVGGVPGEAIEGGGIAISTNLTVVSVWHRDVWDVPEHLEMRLVFLDPSGDELGVTGPSQVNLPQYPVVRMMAKVELLPLHRYGVYTIRVERRSNGGAPWVNAGGEITLGIWAAPAPAAQLNPQLEPKRA